MEGARRELTKRVTDLICAPWKLVEMREGVGALAARYGQPPGMFDSWLDGLLEKVAYQVDIAEKERGDQQVIRRHALDAGESVGQAAMEDSSNTDETLPRRPLPF